MTHGEVTKEQYTRLMAPLNGIRVASRRASGKNLSYLESWDVKAHLTRIFGFGHWDLEMLDYAYLGSREYLSGKEGDNDRKPMVEVMWHARMQLRVRDINQLPLGTYSEAAVGSASVPDNMIGEGHDNALKTAASDALKRCAINLGTQFGLSLYNDGQRNDVIKGTVHVPDGWKPEQPSEEQQKQLAHAVGASGEPTNEVVAEEVAQ